MVISGFFKGLIKYLLDKLTSSRMNNIHPNCTVNTKSSFRMNKVLSEGGK